MIKDEYFHDFIACMLEYIIEDALEAKRKYDMMKNKKNVSKYEIHFQLGVCAAYYRIFSLFQEQARKFNIPLNELNLDKIDPKKDLYIKGIEKLEKRNNIRWQNKMSVK